MFWRKLPGRRRLVALLKLQQFSKQTAGMADTVKYVNLSNRELKALPLARLLPRDPRAVPEPPKRRGWELCLRSSITRACGLVTSAYASCLAPSRAQHGAGDRSRGMGGAG